MYAIAITVTAATDTEVAGILLEQNNQTLTEENINDSSIHGANSLRFCGLNTGGTTFTAGANSTSLQTFTFSARGDAAVRETTAGTGSRAVGFAIATDDVAAVYLAVREIGFAIVQAREELDAFRTAKQKQFDVRSYEWAPTFFSIAALPIPSKSSWQTESYRTQERRKLDVRSYEWEAERPCLRRR
jgi:hypothetical protein